MVHVSALYSCGGLAAVDKPFGVTAVVILIKPLAVVVAYGLDLHGAVLGALPLNIVGSYSGVGVVVKVVFSDFGAEHFCYLNAPWGRVRIVNFVAYAILQD